MYQARDDGARYQEERRKYRSALDVLLMRDQLQSLRTFGGEPREWKMFLHSYNETKHLLSDVANMNRLRKVIVGKAAVAVSDMLTFGVDPEKVMTALSKLFPGGGILPDVAVRGWWSNHMTSSQRVGSVLCSPL